MIKVLKFGGTSVGSAANMKKVAEVVRHEGARITVLSAMSGTTDALVKIVAAAAAGDRDTVENQLAMLTDKYTTCIDGVLGAHREEALGRMKAAFELIRSEVGAFREYTSERTIIAQGELLTSAIFTLYLNETGMKAVCLNSPDFMVTDEDGKVDACRLREALAPVAADQDTFYVAQGFICTNNRSEIDNLGRGGSDYSAALMGAAIDANEVQIWTDIDGLHSNDPRIVSATSPVRRLTFDEASKLAHFGAKILHPTCILPARQKNIPVRLLNTLDPQAPGTLISEAADTGRIKAVAAKDDITYLKIRSTYKVPGYRFLDKVFHCFARSHTPIDLMVTSDTEISLSIDNRKHLPEIAAALSRYADVTVEDDMVVVCVVGDLKWYNVGFEHRIVDSLKDIPVRMISYGDNCDISFVLRRNDKKKALEALNCCVSL